LPVSVASETLAFDWNESRALRELCGWASQPLPINASAWHAGRLHLRLKGARAAVAAACAKLGGEPVPAAQATDWWTRVRDQREEFFLLDDTGIAAGEALWRLSVPAVSGPIELPGRQFIEWNGAQRWWKTTAAAAQVRDAAARVGGHATLMRGADKSQGVFAPLNAVLMRVHHGLKQAFDPNGLFNPDRLYAGL
jgi:glycolate oxidase FAD binding subunit